MFFISLAKKAVFLFVFLIVVSSAQQVPQRVISKGTVEYLSNEVIVKYRSMPGVNSSGTVATNDILLQKIDFLKVKSAATLFPLKAVAASSNGLERIVSIKYDSDIDPEFAAGKMKNIAEIEWVEPRYVYKPSVVPNDPSYNSQWYLTKIKAAEAWDINQGSTSIIVGIDDTGVDWDHPDLNANVWINPGEIENNGTDDDNNGYIDDFRGWDFGGFSGTPDNDPMEDQPDHGTHVAGCASAVTNNGVGVAGIGYNTKVMAVKTSRNDQRDPSSGSPYIVYGYEGLLYSAQNGAKVINCSWGGSGFSMLGQTIVDEVTSLGSVVVAAAGNESVRDPFYPAAYNHVLAVASTTSNDTRSGFSNFGYYVDVVSPGSSIYNTWQNNTYASLSGTSMASPITSGLVALTMAQFPNLTSIQAAEKVRVACDNIDNLNPSFVGLLGKGRINALRSLQNTDFKSVRATEIVFSDAVTGNNDGIFQQGETITVFFRGMNYLNATSNLTATLVSKTAHATVGANPTVTIGTVQPGSQFDNTNSLFQFTISATAPENTDLAFNINFSDDGYSDFQWISTVGNPTYATTLGNKVAVTVTSAGNLGFADYPTNTKGKGFRYEGGNSMLFEGALMLSTAANQIINSARGQSNNGNTQDKDFQSEIPFSLKIPGVKADVEGYGIFNDNLAGGSKLGLQVKQRSYNYSATADEDFVIVRYTIKNVSTLPVTGLYAGLYFDWDLIDGSGDRTEWNTTGNYGKVWNNSAAFTTKVASALISSTNYSFKPMMNDGTAGGINVYDGYSDLEKWTSLSSGVVTGPVGAGDISHVTGGGPFDIAVGDSIEVAFALAASDDDLKLDQAIANARGKWTGITSVKEVAGEVPGTFALHQNYPNPFNPNTIIRFSVPTSGLVKIKVYDLLGNTVAEVVNREMNKGSYEVSFDGKNLSSGIYFYEMTSGNFSQKMKMMLLK